LWHRRQDEAARTGGGEIVVDDDAEAVVFGKAREHRLDVRRAAVDGDLKLLAAQAAGVHWRASSQACPCIYRETCERR
jgi:hypothetical protein